MTRSVPQSFRGSEGRQLAAVFDQPDGEPLGYALYAHCFTCTKDLKGAHWFGQQLADPESSPVPEILGRPNRFPNILTGFRDTEIASLGAKAPGIGRVVHMPLQAVGSIQTNRHQEASLHRDSEAVTIGPVGRNQGAIGELLQTGKDFV